MNTTTRVLLNPGDAHFTDVHFTKAFPALWEMLLEWQLTPVESHLLIHLVARARFKTNVVYTVGHAEIGEATRHHRSSVGRALAHLVDIGAIARTTRDGQRLITVNPLVAYRGNSMERGRVISVHDWRQPANTRPR